MQTPVLDISEHSIIFQSLHPLNLCWGFRPQLIATHPSPPSAADAGSGGPQQASSGQQWRQAAGFPSLMGAFSEQLAAARVRIEHMRDSLLAAAQQLRSTPGGGAAQQAAGGRAGRHAPRNIAAEVHFWSDTVMLRLLVLD